MKCFKNWLFFILFIPTFANASQGKDCAWLLTGNPSGEFSASQGLNQIIREQVAELGLPLTVQTESTFFTRWRAKRLLKQASVSNFQDENFRNRWIERVISLKIDENIDLLNQLSHPLSESQRTALLRLVLRTLVHRGLAKHTDQAKPKTNWRAILNKISSHPAFRMIFYWELPRQHLTLSDEKLLDVVQNGEDSISDSLSALVTAEQREARKRTINKWTATAVGVFLAGATVWTVYPELDKAYESGRERAIQENTQVLVNHVSQLTELNSDALTLGMARSEIEMLTAQFVKRYGESPTAAEASELRTQVCIVRYEGILTSESQAQCMAQAPIPLSQNGN